MIGAVEAGGTKFVCGVGTESGQLISEERFTTSDPQATLVRMVDSLRRQGAAVGALAAIGVGSFGPVERDMSSPHYGHILRTPKPGWSMTDLAGTLARQFDCPIGFDTDVNAAAIAEHRWGAARDVSNLVYITVGTGIGGGTLIAGRPVHGMQHPEIGHLYPRRHPFDRDFPGVCPFHGDCVEGLASGPAIIARCGKSIDQLHYSHRQWEIQADYLGQLCHALVLAVSPQRIILGGGVMNEVRLLPMIHARMQHWLGGYIDRPDRLGAASSYLMSPGLGAQAGVLGALALGIDAAAQVRR